MQTKAEIKKIEATPEARISKHIEENIEQKLNYDGRWHTCLTSEGISRLSTLTREESDFLGRTMGWDQPYYNEVDWENVPTPFLAACCEIEHGMRALQLNNPAPSLKPLIDRITSDDEADFLQGVITLDQLKAKYGEVEP
ncbi:hypothetical protein [Trichlorobacter lovleyi]|uniref:hypothetical protein n=1 Tax=Trichlorobacter lovleyi TaxID=313985 RepID=UPI003D0D9A09